MKLFLKQTKKRAETYPKNAFISIGRCIADDLYDGWYIKLTFPFTRLRTYVDIVTFENKLGPCRYQILIRYRPLYPYKLFKLTSWAPVDLNKE